MDKPVGFKVTSSPEQIVTSVNDTVGAAYTVTVKSLAAAQEVVAGVKVKITSPPCAGAV